MAELLGQGRCLLSMSLKDKLKPKGRRSEVGEPEGFDESALQVTLSPIGSQLTPLTVSCDWAVPSPAKVPSLECRWYNRTTHNIAEIQGVDSQQYQPCLADVGSIIEVSCVPQGNYLGMPILLKTVGVTLAPTTEQEATLMLQAGRARFTVDLRQGRIKGRNVYPGMQVALKVESGTMAVCLVRHGSEEPLKEVPIDDLFPQLTPSRPRPRELSMRLTEEEHCTVLFRNNELRDVFCLLNKLILATGKSPSNDSQSTRPRSPNPSQDHPESASWEDFPEKEPPASRSECGRASELLQIANLREQLRTREEEGRGVRGELESARERVRELEGRLSETSQRLASATKNYFELEEELGRSRQECEALRRQLGEAGSWEKEQQEEAVYYKNEAAILRETVGRLREEKGAVEARLSGVREQMGRLQEGEDAGEGRSYGELLGELRHEKELKSELELKQRYSLSEREQLEDQLRDSRSLLEQAHSANHYLSKKCEALASELSSPLPSSKLSDSRSDLSRSLSVEEGPAVDPGELRELRRQLEETAAENRYVRGLLGKEKKASSRSHLKLELYEVKKLVKRLSENVAEKDMCIAQLRTVNRDLNSHNVRLEEQISQLQRQAPQPSERHEH